MKWIKHFGAQRYVNEEGAFLGLVIKERPTWLSQYKLKQPRSIYGTYYSWYALEGADLKLGGAEKLLSSAKKRLAHHIEGDLKHDVD